MNDRLIDHTDVLLLQPVRAERGVALLPALDAVRDADGAHGIAVAQVFPVETKFMPAAAQAARALGASGLLRGEPELVVLDPTRRSRLRWLEQAGR
jgi:hypothetical protein